MATPVVSGAVDRRRRTGLAVARRGAQVLAAVALVLVLALALAR